jgi:mannose-6-phosphate isomerase-like protein (cupin superfamily)
MKPPVIVSPLAGNVAGQIGQDFVIAEWKDAGGPPGPPRWIARLHLHHHDDEAWYVLEGRLHVRVGPELLEVRAGSAVVVPRGTAHTYCNPDPTTVRYLLVMTSNIYALIREIHSTADRAPATMRMIFEKYDSELLEG